MTDFVTPEKLSTIFAEVYNGWPLQIVPLLPAEWDTVELPDGHELRVGLVSDGIVYLEERDAKKYDAWTAHLRPSVTHDGLFLYLEASSSERDGYECVCLTPETPPGHRKWRVQRLNRPPVEKFVPRDLATRTQMAMVIIQDVLSRLEAGALTESEAWEELRERLKAR